MPVPRPSLALFAVPLLAARIVAAQGAASTCSIFLNGTVYLDADRRAENLLVCDGVVAGVDVRAADYPSAELVDMQGGAAYPGFVDSHVHLIAIAVAMSVGIPLNGATTSEGIAAILGEHCAKLPSGVPAIAHGFVFDDYGAWSLADLAKIDAVTGARPVMIADQLGHSYIVNSAAMALAGLTGKTPDPPGGRIVRENGAPTGMLRETAGALVCNEAIFPLIPDSLVRQPAALFFQSWAAMGYTGVIELMGGPMGRILKPGLCRELESEGRLPLRIHWANTFFSLDDLESYRAGGADTDLVRFAGLKLFVDGAAGNGDAWNSFPNAKGGYGLSAIATDDSFGPEYNIHRIVQRAEELGLDSHYHVGGDLSIEAVLDAVEGVARKNGGLRTRHTLYHLGFVTDAQIARMGALGEHVVAGVQPSLHWSYSKEITRQFYGAHADGSYPYRKLRDAGVTLAFSTDFASTPLGLCSPQEIMRAALTGAGDPVAHPPLSMHDMIEGFTVGGYATTSARDVGRLDVGYKADIVLFSRDLYSVSPEKLGPANPEVLATWVGGREMYSSPHRFRRKGRVPDSPVDRVP